MRRLESDRLTLEPQVSAHAPAMFVVLSDPAIYRYENVPPPSEHWLSERFARLESRQSADGGELWLNWVLRLQRGELIGYVQATIHADGRAAIAYVLCSAHWGRGLAREAVMTMIGELGAHYGVRLLSAVLKRENARSLHLLERLGFAAAPAAMRAGLAVETDELLLQRDIDCA